MPDNSVAIWKNQPPDLQSHQHPNSPKRDVRSLSQRTRSEILSSAASAVFFVSILLWRFEVIRDRYVLLSFVPIAAWVLATIWWHRKRIWQTEASLAAPGIEFYRGELERRRRHLSSLWLWHGPLILTSLSLAAVWLRKSVVSLERLVSISPPLLVLAIWTILGIRRRRRESTAIEDELKGEDLNELT